MKTRTYILEALHNPNSLSIDRILENVPNRFVFDLNGGFTSFNSEEKRPSTEYKSGGFDAYLNLQIYLEAFMEQINSKLEPGQKAKYIVIMDDNFGFSSVDVYIAKHLIDRIIVSLESDFHTKCELEFAFISHTGNNPAEGQAIIDKCITKITDIHKIETNREAVLAKVALDAKNQNFVLNNLNIAYLIKLKKSLGLIKRKATGPTAGAGQTHPSLAGKRSRDEFEDKQEDLEKNNDNLQSSEDEKPKKKRRKKESSLSDATDFSAAGAGVVDHKTDENLHSATADETPGGNGNTVLGKRKSPEEEPRPPSPFTLFSAASDGAGHTQNETPDTETKEPPFKKPRGQSSGAGSGS